MTTRLFPQRLEIQILADGLPVPGALADVTLSMTSKNPHSMVLGPADELGRIVATGTQLLEKAWDNCRNFVMDYADPAQSFGGSVEVKTVTPARIKEMQAAPATYSQYFKYPQNWLAILAELDRWFAGHAVTMLLPRASVSPADIRLSLPLLQL